MPSLGAYLLSLICGSVFVFDRNKYNSMSKVDCGKNVLKVAICLWLSYIIFVSFQEQNFCDGQKTFPYLLVSSVLDL